MPDFVTPAAAFALGLALARANSCTVASARRLIVDRRADWLFGLTVAISWAGLTLALFAVFLPRVVVLPAQVPIGWNLFIGGIIMGIGATLNRGCFLGSVASLGRGELPFAFSLCGIALAMNWSPALLDELGIGLAPVVSGFRDPAALLVAAAVFAPIAMAGLLRWFTTRRSPVLALIAVGTAGGTVYACNPGWNYSSGLYRLTHLEGTAGLLAAEAGTIAVVAGVAISAVASGRFALQRGRLADHASRLGGGMLMGTGAMLVPGGNDTLMLWAIPGLTWYGPVAYATMLFTIMLLIALHQAAGGTPASIAARSRSGRVSAIERAVSRAP